MLDKKDPCHGRQKTQTTCECQAVAVREIVEAPFGGNAGAHPFVILGDFNDYLDTDAQGQTGIADLVEWGQVVNIVTRRLEQDRWTHCFKGNKHCGIPASCHQLDYLARIIHEGFVNNPGLPDSQPFPPVAGGYVVVGGHRAVSRCTGDARSVPDRRPQGVLFSPHCSRAAFAKNAG